MADKKKIDIANQRKTNRNLTANINALLNQLSSSVFGTEVDTTINDLNTSFNDIVKGETDSFKRITGDDTSSFISNLLRDSKQRTVGNYNLMDQIDNIFSDYGTEGNVEAFINEAYRNRLLKQSDIHEVASQLIELREAILITRDAIVSSDIVEGRMSRKLSFDPNGLQNEDELIDTVKMMETKFKLQNKIKDFIVPKALEYGEYNAYVIPYSKIFSDFMQRKTDPRYGYGTMQNMYHETTLYEFVHDDKNIENGKLFQESVDDIYKNEYSSTPKSMSDGMISKLDFEKEDKKNKELFNENVNKILKNITICNEPMPLNILEEGSDSFEYFVESVKNEAITEDKNNIGNIGSNTFFHQVLTSDSSSGEYITNIRSSKNKDNKKNEFKDIHDCYLKMIDPIHLIPVQIMKKRIGYYYIQNEEIAPLTGVVSSSLYYNRFEDQRRDSTIIDAIANQIVLSFDKKFLDKNMKFKSLIVEALNYFNLNEQRIRFQFIPEEYIVPFKVAEDENENGTSIIEGSLFYAKLYLMLLLFKMMSIILYSNDTRVNYIKTSGIDKNVRKKIEEIARNKQQRTINVMDMFSYTSLVNKLGVGSETYIPTGKSGERGIETEILQGQDVQLNTDLMDMLRKAYILGTGVPDAIMNYMNEADFAKSLELANTRFMGRVVNYQIDFNDSITDLYKRMMRWSTSIDESDIETFRFEFAPPKSNNGQIKSDIIGNFQTYSEFVIGLLFGQQNLDDPEKQPIINAVRLALAKDYMPMINFDKIESILRTSNIDGIEELLIPKGEEDLENDPDLEGL